jgi:hypothetical protein
VGGSDLRGGSGRRQGSGREAAQVGSERGRLDALEVDDVREVVGAVGVDECAMVDAVAALCERFGDRRWRTDLPLGLDDGGAAAGQPDELSVEDLQPVGYVNSFMLFVGTHGGDRRAGRVDECGRADPC